MKLLKHNNNRAKSTLKFLRILIFIEGAYFLFNLVDLLIIKTLEKNNQEITNFFEIIIKAHDIVTLLFIIIFPISFIKLQLWFYRAYYNLAD